MQRKIDLKSKITIDKGSGCHRLKMWVNEYQDMEPEIFVYQRYPQLPGETEPADHFVNLASAADMKDHPKGAPAGNVPFFRLSYIDIIFRSADLLSKTVALINQDTMALIANLDKLDTLGTTKQYDFQGKSLSSSSSSSLSSHSSNSSSSLSSRSSLSSSSRNSSSSSSSSSRHL